ncbi:MAG TPA: hypothetical protein PLT09_09730 [Deltaproteobacteria bacterium]|nr:hypothetical protein [Deltaproteobacteria bacterium]HXK47711.1 hypothetical protein [Deltaproteobacteria bacterium]
MTDIHLCQPDTTKSCAACCGIYNYVDNTREALLQRFLFRTRLFARVRENRMSLEDYREVIRHRENAKRIYTTIYTCEFVGFLDEACLRVGCMLHPLSNDGNDMRTISFYGRDICDGHFCPSYQKLANHEVRILLAALDDWYLYGAVITDIDYVKTFFHIIQNRVGETLDAGKVENRPALLETVRRYCGLKTAWPFRDTMRPRFGKYYFVGEEYDIARIDYGALGAEPSPYDAIFASLSSHFQNKDELDRANLVVHDLIGEFCSAYTDADR